MRRGLGTLETKKTVINSLKLTEEKDPESIALPAINTYIFDI